MIAELEKIYPEGSDLTLLNTYYQRRIWDRETNGLVTDDFLVLMYKDNVAGKKKHIILKNPDYEFYLLKDKYATPDYNMLFIERDKVDPVHVPFSKLEKTIAEKTGNLEFYKQNIANRNKEENRKLHTNPRVFFSDSNIEDHYRFRFSQTYQNEVINVTKGFFDIEVDGKFAKGDFVEMGECEVNCVSYLDLKKKTVYTFILRNQNNPLIDQFEKEIEDGRFGYKELHEFVINAVGGIKKAKKYNVDEFQFDLRFYDYEIELIKDLFLTIHRCSPDFCLSWNGSMFDISYLIERIRVLGYDPADVMCHPEWEAKVVRNYVDERNKNDLPERGDYTFISGYTVFIDQMLQYASRRKAKYGSMNSFKLDDVGLREAKVQKLDYHHITKSVLELPWLDFKTFVIYNIMDTIVQHCIESVTNDIEYIFTKCLINNTVYQKGHRQTVYLINRIASSMYKSGYIIGNNCNKWNPTPPKFAGALVSDPVHTNDYSKLKIDGRAIWVCDNLMDYDYKSLYPSIMLEFNIAPNTQVGRIVIPEQVYDLENVYMSDTYSRGGEFVENLVSDNYIEFCKRWFHLAGFKEMLFDFDDYMSQFGYGKYSELVKKNSPILPTTGDPTPAIIFSNRYKGYTGSIIFQPATRPSTLLSFETISEAYSS